MPHDKPVTGWLDYWRARPRSTLLALVETIQPVVLVGDVSQLVEPDRPSIVGFGSVVGSAIAEHAVFEIRAGARALQIIEVKINQSLAPWLISNVELISIARFEVTPGLERIPFGYEKTSSAFTGRISAAEIATLPWSSAPRTILAGELVPSLLLQPGETFAIAHSTANISPVITAYWQEWP